MSDLLTAQEEVELAELMAAGRAAEAALAAGTNEPGLDEAAAAGRDARDRFIEANLRLAHRLAGRYRRTLGDDADQEAVIGLIKAVDRFDPAKGFRFSTYATWWIRQALTAAAGQAGDIVRCPENARRAAPAVRRAEAQLTAAGAPASVQAVAAAAELDEGTVAAVLRPATARFEDHDPDRRPVTETLAALDGDPEDAACRSVAAGELRRAVTVLPPEQRRVLVAAFGLDGSDPLTMSEMSRRWGIHRVSLTRTRDKALGALRESLTADTVARLADGPLSGVA